MLLLTTAGVLDIAFSGASVVIALVSTVGQFWRVDALKRTTENLRHLASIDDRPTDDTALLELLRDASLIAPHVRAAIKRRLFIALGVIIALAFAAPINEPGPEIQGVPGLDWVDPIIFAAQLATALLVNRKWLITDLEREYLAHVGGLQDLYHERFVLPAIKGFDRKLRSSPIARELKSVEEAAKTRVQTALKPPTDGA